MTINYKEIMKVVTDLCEQEQLRVTLNGSWNSMLIAGFCTGIGGLLGGTVGAAAGAWISGVGILAFGPKYKSLKEVIENDLTPAQRASFNKRMNRIIDDFQIHDAVSLAVLVSTSGSVQTAVLNVLNIFVSTELKLKLSK